MLRPSMQSLLVGAAFFLSCVGCGRVDGPQLATVSGTVTLDGKPVPQVNITFVPETQGGSPSFGSTDANGKYTLLFSQDRAGAMLGKHRVEIEAQEPEVGDDGEPIAPAAEVVPIPVKFSQPGALSAEVKSGNNTIDFPLKSE
jgi:hypothetical protein